MAVEAQKVKLSTLANLKLISSSGFPHVPWQIFIVTKILDAVATGKEDTHSHLYLGNVNRNQPCHFAQKLGRLQNGLHG
jgi:GDP-D-mannose dehydratase